MSQTNIENEKIKRLYMEWMKESEGLNELTVKHFITAITFYDKFTRNADYKKFNEKLAIEFKKHLSEHRHHKSGNLISLDSKRNYLLRLNHFFKWLSMRKGFKSHINPDAFSYLRLSMEEIKRAAKPPKRVYPSLEMILKVINSIEIKTEVDKRDRALFALMLLTGARASALITLPLSCINVNSKKIHQRPDKNVKTKRSKYITTTFFEFDQILAGLVEDWVNFLRYEKFYTDDDPIFPATKIEHKSKAEQFFTAQKISKDFWAFSGGLRVMFKKRFTEAGLPYFPPHCIRHLVIKLATELCETPAEFKAVSQNLGHENVATTMWDYASLRDEDVESTIKKLTSKPTDEEQKDLEDLLNKIKSYRKNKRLNN